jgi:ubiquinone/menaquinone biosynthesis C-methylase UbiE
MVDRRAWNLEDSKLIDIGSGQGGLVLEALTRGADAHGIEPSDKYVHTSRVRLSEEGYNPDRVCCAKGESLPFSDDTFDYACNLYVLEHVPDPEPILKEIYRVLRPGGELHLRCENYLSFREQHYRVPWLPMLPKPIGKIYLLLLGRDPSFLDNYVYYSTYPQVIRITSNIGFENNTYDKMLDKVETLSGITSQSSKLASHLMTPVPASLRRKIADIILYLRNLFAVGVQLHLVKPLK